MVNRLYRLSTDHEPALVSELSAAYNAFRSDGLINDIPRLDYILRYLRIDMLTDETVANALAPQLSQYVMDINTLKEADFCNSKSILERIYVTTVHRQRDWSLIMLSSLMQPMDVTRTPITRRNSRTRRTLVSSM